MSKPKPKRIDLAQLTIMQEMNRIPGSDITHVVHMRLIKPQSDGSKRESCWSMGITSEELKRFREDLNAFEIV